jgi:hypothetical protein
VKRILPSQNKSKCQKRLKRMFILAGSARKEMGYLCRYTCKNEYIYKMNTYVKIS